MENDFTDTLPCENCICLCICKEIYNGLLYAYLKDMKHANQTPFKPGALAKARIHLANRCSLMDAYLYSSHIDGSTNLKREKIHQIYFTKDDPILRREYQR